MGRGARDAGFTLVELLVALALLGMAAVLVGQGLASDHAALGRIERRTSGGEQVAAAQALIRDRLEHLFADARYEGTVGVTDFDGDAGGASFLASAPTGDAGRQVQRFRLDLAPTGDLALGLDAAPATGRTVLLRGVKTLELAYWGADAGAPNPAWQPSWSRRKNPPALVRVRLAFDEGDRRAWPELIVRPAVTVNTDCIYDPAENVCRGES